MQSGSSAAKVYVEGILVDAVPDVLSTGVGSVVTTFVVIGSASAVVVTSVAMFGTLSAAFVVIGTASAVVVSTGSTVATFGTLSAAFVVIGTASAVVVATGSTVAMFGTLSAAEVPTSTPEDSEIGVLLGWSLVLTSVMDVHVVVLDSSGLAVALVVGALQNVVEVVELSVSGWGDSGEWGGGRGFGV